MCNQTTVSSIRRARQDYTNEEVNNILQGMVIDDDSYHAIRAFIMSNTVSEIILINLNVFSNLYALRDDGR